MRCKGVTDDRPESPGHRRAGYKVLQFAVVKSPTFAGLGKRKIRNTVRYTVDLDLKTLTQVGCAAPLGPN